MLAIVRINTLLERLWFHNLISFFDCLVFREWELQITHTFFFRSVNVFLSMLAKPEFRLEMLVGSCTAWSMEFSLMARCPATRLSAEETIPSTHFLARLERENTFLAPCSLTWNQQLSVSYNKGKKTGFSFIYSFELKRVSLDHRHQPILHPSNRICLDNFQYRHHAVLLIIQFAVNNQLLTVLCSWS